MLEPQSISKTTTQISLTRNAPFANQSQKSLPSSLMIIGSKPRPSHRFPIEFQQAIAQAGWLGICMPSQYGGSDLGIAEAAIMVQTISESGAAYAGASAVHMNIFGLEPVRKFANEEQKQRMLVPLIAGKERACFGVTEPNTGLDTLRLQSFASKDPKTCDYVLKGNKIWISTAQVAEKILILVRTNETGRLCETKSGSQPFLYGSRSLAGRCP